MARAGNPYNPESAYNTAGSQFFIVTTDSTFLDGDYAAFGKVTEGMEAVDDIVNVEVVTRDPYEEGADRPVNPPVIKKMTVDTFGVSYGEPTKITK
jgi:peptidyl-prolyl cis-trans isomerase B (cyclophilin B)